MTHQGHTRDCALCAEQRARVVVASASTEQGPHPRNTPPDFVDLPVDPKTPPYYTTFTVVVVRGVRDTWSAYFGPPDWTFTQVLSSGNKLPLDAARQMFPNIVGRYNA